MWKQSNQEAITVLVKSLFVRPWLMLAKIIFFYPNYFKLILQRKSENTLKRDSHMGTPLEKEMKLQFTWPSSFYLLLGYSYWNLNKSFYLSEPASPFCWILQSSQRP